VTASHTGCKDATEHVTVDEQSRWPGNRTYRNSNAFEHGNKFLRLALVRGAELNADGSAQQLNRLCSASGNHRWERRGEDEPSGVRAHSVDQLVGTSNVPAKRAVPTAVRACARACVRECVSCVCVRKQNKKRENTGIKGLNKG
jgi:hypothetical protein